MKFQIGDSVRTVSSPPPRYEGEMSFAGKNGDVGCVQGAKKFFNRTCYAVEYDFPRPEYFHGCEGLVHSARGYWIAEEMLAPVGPMVVSEDGELSWK